MFEENHGYLRKEVTKAIYSFLDCGIPENGIARIRCKKCGNDYFVSFSCRQRVVCPSCSTKRNRKLLKLLVKSANYAVNKYFNEALKIDDGLIGGVYYIQSQGNMFNYHPHVHGLVTCGVMKAGVFNEQTNISTAVIAEIFRRKLLALLQKKK